MATRAKPAGLTAGRGSMGERNPEMTRTGSTSVLHPGQAMLAPAVDVSALLPPILLTLEALQYVIGVLPAGSLRRGRGRMGTRAAAANEKQHLLALGLGAEFSLKSRRRIGRRTVPYHVRTARHVADITIFLGRAHIDQARRAALHELRCFTGRHRPGVLKAEFCAPLGSRRKNSIRARGRSGVSGRTGAMRRRPPSCLRNAHGVCSRSIASDQIAPEKMRRGKMRPTTTPDKADFAAPSLSGTNASRGDGDQRKSRKSLHASPRLDISVRYGQPSASNNITERPLSYRRWKCGKGITPAPTVIAHRSDRDGVGFLRLPFCHCGAATCRPQYMAATHNHCATN